MANLGLDGLADGLHPGVNAGAGARFAAWSVGLTMSFSTIQPAPEHYAYFVVCYRDWGDPCSAPVLDGTFASSDLQLRLHPFRFSRVEPFVEGRAGWNALFLSDPTYAPLGQIDFAMQGLHLAAALGTRLRLMRRLSAIGSVGYSFSLVDRPATMVGGGGIFTDLIFIANHGHQLQIALGAQVQL